MTNVTTTANAPETPVDTVLEERDADSVEGEIVTPRQQAMIDNAVSVAEEFGPFDTGSRADGAHYAPAAANPFKADGLVCSNCELYQPISDTEGRCAVVQGPLTDGRIEADAICKLWVIPESELPAPPAARTDATVPATRRIVTAGELRNNPDLLAQVRSGALDLEERRTVNTSMEIRELKTGEFRLAGHAAVFESRSEDMGFIEIIARGAFRKVLATKPDVVATFNHSMDMVLGRTSSGTLRLAEDTRGLGYEIDVAPTTYGLDLQTLMARGDVNQSSFAFTIGAEDQTWSEDPNTGQLIRTIHNFQNLYDVSVVTRPAYAAAESTLVRTQESSTIESEQDAGGTAEQPSGQVDDGARQHDESQPANQSKAWWVAHMRVNGRA